MAQRILWAVIVAFFAYLAVAAPVKIMRERDEADDAEAAAATEPADEGGADAEPAKATLAPLVAMQGLKFQPNDLVVDRGATVRFDNKDVAPHTVTQKGGDIDSGVIDPGKSFSLTVEEPFEYVCTIHPSMRADIRLSG
jgi:plastocyanin